jgi:putrescine aminotransferase
MLWAVELTNGKKPLDATLGVGSWIREYCYKRGMILRNNGDILVIAPALVMTKEQIDEMIALMARAVSAAARHFRIGRRR